MALCQHGRPMSLGPAKYSHRNVYAGGTIHEAVSKCNMARIKVCLRVHPPPHFDRCIQALVEEGLRQEESGIQGSKPTGFVDETDDRGVEPLHVAAGLTEHHIQDQIDLIEFLLVHGADPNRSDTDDGLGPLHIAIEHENVETVDFRANHFY